MALKGTYDAEKFTANTAKWADSEFHTVLLSIDQMYDIFLMLQRQLIPINVIQNIGEPIVLWKPIDSLEIENVYQCSGSFIRFSHTNSYLDILASITNVEKLNIRHKCHTIAGSEVQLKAITFHNFDKIQ